MSPIFIAGDTAPTVAEASPGPPPRPVLRSNERRPDPRHWTTVIPPVLAEQIAGAPELEAHRELVARVERAASRVGELVAAHAQAVDKDRQAETDFAAGKARRLRAPLGPDAEAAVGQARRELELLERELPASANAVLDAAYPHLEDALRELERRLDVDDDRVEAAIMEALRALDERAQVAREAQWIGLALWESSVSPFGATRAVANTPAAAELRQTVARLRDERAEAARRRFERQVEVEMHFLPNRAPRAVSGRPLHERRLEAERVVREREAAR